MASRDIAGKVIEGAVTGAVAAMFGFITDRLLKWLTDLSRIQVMLLAVVAGLAAWATILEILARRRSAKTPPGETGVGTASSASDSLLISPVSLIRTFAEREEAYRAIPEVIARVSEEQPGTKQLLLAALHGHSGDRMLSRAAAIPAYSSFDSALIQCVRSFGAGMWYVRELYNITSEDRLDEVCEWLKNTSDEGYEVRAYCAPHAIPHLAPLVIGKRDFFLGIEDPRYYRVRRAMHIQDEAGTGLVVEYFESVWNGRDVLILRSGVGPEWKNIETLREKIKDLHKHAKRASK